MAVYLMYLSRSGSSKCVSIHHQPSVHLQALYKCDTALLCLRDGKLVDLDTSNAHTSKETWFSDLEGSGTSTQHCKAAPLKFIMLNEQSSLLGHPQSRHRVERSRKLKYSNFIQDKHNRGDKNYDQSFEAPAGEEFSTCEHRNTKTHITISNTIQELCEQHRCCSHYTTEQHTNK